MAESQRIHFIGIGGYGMSALAHVLLDQGYTVSGSDVVAQSSTAQLALRGAHIHIGHDAAHVTGAHRVIYSSAVASHNVERQAAQAQGIPTLHRAEVLAEWLHRQRGIAVTGAHGKTTTTSLIAFVLEQCGVDPTYVIGGELMHAGHGAKAGKGEYVVAEADESDGTFLYYRPHMAVITNIEADHLENFDGDFTKLVDAYAQFMRQVDPEGHVIVCVDDPILASFVQNATMDATTHARQAPFLTYGFHPQATYRATDVQLDDRRVAFDFWQGDVLKGRIALPMPGKHNIQNALAALIVCEKVGVDFVRACEALRQFQGTKRRFHVLYEGPEQLIVDDYAHHPTEITATIASAKATGRRVVVVFEPQRYSRTFFLLESFSRAFKEADEVIITDIYAPAGELPKEGVNAEQLTEKIRAYSHPDAQYLPTHEAVRSALCSRPAKGEVIVTMGAGNIWQVAYALAKHRQHVRDGQGEQQ